MHDKFDYGDEFENFICPNPFLYGEVRADGEMATCCYLPFTFGNIKKDGLENAWNSPIAKAVRSSILDGSYRFCDKRKCATMQQVTNPEKQASYKYQIPYQLFTRDEVVEGPLGETFKGQLELDSAGPKIVSFEDDPSCNLACPSCRVKPIMISKESSGDMYDLEVSLLDALGPQLEQVWFAGAGDPFVSRSYRRLYKEYDFERFPKLKFRLDTNGVPLTPKTWNELLRKVKHKVGLVCLSIDAVTKETYDITRVGGNFDLLMDNLKFICSVPEREQGMGILIRMIVQQKNFREMKEFVELGKRVGVDAVVFSVIQNWGTFSEQDYKQAAVHVPTSQYYAELREILSDPIFEDPIVNIGNLSDLYFDVRKDTAWTRAIKVNDAPKALGSSTPNCRAIAFYLPQFHPIPENDEWWGKGFTEWTNVTKAHPLYEGQYQPHIPTDLGYYDLRLPEVREAQADLARAAGIEAFCYWHYWFAGRRVLERPFQEVVASKKPNFGFCIGWANASWTGVWHGAPNRTLIEQTYPGLEDYKNHFDAVLPALRDERYFRVNGKPLVLLYAPHELPNAMEFTNYWRELAHKAGVGDLHFVAHMAQNPTPFGCDTAVLNAPFTQIPLPQIEVRPLNGEEVPRVWTYDSFVQYMETSSLEEREHPIVFPNWDNTPRSGARGLVLDGSTPELFLKHLRDAVSKAQHFTQKEERIVFIKAWNEWAEGNYLEPDRKFGHAYLDAVKTALFETPIAREVRSPKTEIVHVAEKIPTSHNVTYQSTDSIPAVVAAADSLASRGDLVGAVNEITKHISGKNPIPAGVQMRLAEWNLALGKGEEAVFAALQELTTRPDNQKALGILLHDQPTLFKVLAQVPAPTVRLVEQIINSYAQRGGM
jgi:MoaA/NifB/PqqE/SkfB family radical SAM enzyme